MTRVGLLAVLGLVLMEMVVSVAAAAGWWRKDATHGGRRSLLEKGVATGLMLGVEPSLARMVVGWRALVAVVVVEVGGAGVVGHCRFPRERILTFQ